ncbi:MAG: histidine triad nucleotide-binding protein [Gammaproteobacteria bacterium]|nr:histidine triad nucleotide-binding protein [Gammaproteobacteria bacterium]MBU1725859.1 histidine triad nucleotide-binding protein [Gammaproteobacteria bacterium]MBU2005159.1 histidine triad nucleotide-binding protein [Gammaproteobacteria bacterium]
MSNCLFCRIAAGEIPAKIAYEDNDVVAFHDINPQAPLHVVIIPRKHIATINDIEAGDAELVGKLYLAAQKIAADAGHAEDGYRVVMNCGADAGQSVFHIHLHLLAGRHLSWPPG